MSLSKNGFITKSVAVTEDKKFIRELGHMNEGVNLGNIVGRNLRKDFLHKNLVLIFAACRLVVL